MEKSDLCVARQKLLVPIEVYSGAPGGALALVPPPTPHFIQLTGIHNELIRAHEGVLIHNNVKVKLNL